LQAWQWQKFCLGEWNDPGFSERHEGILALELRLLRLQIYKNIVEETFFTRISILLQRLQILNYALIDHLAVSFKSGLNIVTGETGAGKSILIDALELVLGGRASPEMIRSGERRMEIVAQFSLRAEHACWTQVPRGGDGELKVKRVVTASRRSYCYVNDNRVSVQQLREVGKELVDLHGQQGHQSLLKIEKHLDFLDKYGGLEECKRKVAAGYDGLLMLKKRRSVILENERMSTANRELLLHQIGEIKEANPIIGEDAEIDQEISVFENSERLSEISGLLEGVLNESDDSVVTLLGQAKRLMGEVSDFDSNLAPMSEQLNELRYIAEELTRFFANYSKGIERNPERLAELSYRADLLYSLKKKYGGDLSSVMDFYHEANKNLEKADKGTETVGSLDETISLKEKEFITACVALSEGRKKAAKSLTKAICSTLKKLGIENAQFEIDLKRRLDKNGLQLEDGQRYWCDSRGLERGEFGISTNPGEDIRPLAKVASGGELSRIMLALKTVLTAHDDSVQVLIFDEIDSGISGRIADVVGRQLKRLSKNFQTISITHLPQIAKMADRHLAVRKKITDGRTITDVRMLNDNERVIELASMLGGEEITELTMLQAEEMLKK